MSSVALTNVVVSAFVPNVAIAPGTKFVPLIVSVNAAPPETAELGLKLVIVAGDTDVIPTATEVTL